MLRDGVGRQQHDVFMKLEQDIKEFRREINKYLDTLQEELLKQKDSLQEKENGSLQTSLSVTDTMISELDEISSILADQENHKLYLHLEISSRKVQSQIKAFEKQLLEFNDFNDSLSFEFLPNKELQKYLRNASCLGRIKDAEKILDQGQRKDQDTRVKIPAQGRIKQNNHGNSEATGMTSQVATQSNERENASTVASKPPIFYVEELSASASPSICLKYMSMMHVSYAGMSEGVGTWVKRCVVLDEHNLAILDGYRGSVNIFNLDNKVIKYEYDLKDPQSDITYIHPDTIVVTTGRRLIYLNKQLKYQKEVQLQGKCYAVIYSRQLSTLFVIVKVKTWQIQLFNKNASVIKTLTVPADVFEEPDYMAVSKDGRNIIISDRKLDTLKSINMEGKVNFICVWSKKSYPAGVTVDQHNNIYTVCRTSSILFVISSKGQPKQKINLFKDTDFHAYPFSLAWNEDYTRLYVGCYYNILALEATQNQ